MAIEGLFLPILYLCCMNTATLRTLEVTRYLVPLREGGSLPAIVEGDDDELYVLKFRGAGQGVKALIAELIGGELGRVLGLHVPELVLMQLDDVFAKSEPDEEVQDLLRFSVGLNLGLTFLPMAITYDPLVPEVDALTASKIVLFDSLITNIDRTHKNTNLLNWEGALWLIDHGASLYFHHAMDNWEAHAQRSFPAIKDHVLLAQASELEAASRVLAERLDGSALTRVLDLIPDDWLEEENSPHSPAARKNIYREFLQMRLSRLDQLTQEATDARKAHI